MWGVGIHATSIHTYIMYIYATGLESECHFLSITNVDKTQGQYDILKTSSNVSPPAIIYESVLESKPIMLLVLTHTNRYYCVIGFDFYESVLLCYWF